MYFSEALKKRNKLGFSLVEIVVVLLIASTLSAIAIPKYLAAKARGNYSAAQNDGKSLQLEIRSTLSEVQNPGTTNGTITFAPTTETFTITLGSGGDTIAPFTQNLTRGTTVTGITYANTYNWCIDVINASQHAIFNQDGFVPNAVACP